MKIWPFEHLKMRVCRAKNNISYVIDAHGGRLKKCLCIIDENSVPLKVHYCNN